MTLFEIYRYKKLISPTGKELDVSSTYVWMIHSWRSIFQNCWTFPLVCGWYYFAEHCFTWDGRSHGAINGKSLSEKLNIFYNNKYNDLLRLTNYNMTKQAEKPLVMKILSQLYHNSYSWKNSLLFPIALFIFFLLPKKIEQPNP